MCEFRSLLIPIRDRLLDFSNLYCKASPFVPFRLAGECELTTALIFPFVRAVVIQTLLVLHTVVIASTTNHIDVIHIVPFPHIIAV